MAAAMNFAFGSAFVTSGFLSNPQIILCIPKLFLEPKVNKTKLDTAKSNLAIATQKRKGAEAKLAQTLFEGKNKSFKKQDDFTFSPKTGRSKKVSEQKAKGGRVGLKLGTKKKSNVEKINKTFGTLSVRAGIDNNPNPTYADKIAGAKMKKKKKKVI